jgi:hypothetical protein
MRDKSLDMFLIVLFGISGITVLILAWLQPMITSERILTTFIGLGGLFMALARVWLFKSVPASTDTEQVPLEVKAKDKP